MCQCEEGDGTVMRGSVCQCGKGEYNSHNLERGIVFCYHLCL